MMMSTSGSTRSGVGWLSGALLKRSLEGIMPGAEGEGRLGFDGCDVSAVSASMALGEGISINVG